MADGLARSSHQLAVISHISKTAMAQCFLNQVPLLILDFTIRKETEHRPVTERTISKKVYTASTHQELFDHLKSAIHLCFIPPLGPVVVKIPTNLYLNEGAYCPDWKKPDELHLINLSQLEKIESQLNTSSSVGLYLGQGAIMDQDHLIELADRLDALVFSTISAKGVFPEDHPRFAWNVIGQRAPKNIQKLTSPIDCWLVIGTQFSDVPTTSFNFNSTQKLIHVDIDRNVFHHRYPAHLTLECLAEVFVSTINVRKKLKIRSNNRERLFSLYHAHKEIIEYQSSKKELVQGEKNPTILPFDFIQAITNSFPATTIFITDSNKETLLAMEHLRLSLPKHFLSPTNLSGMGYAIEVAIGAKLANPDKTVVALVGDSTNLESGIELLATKAKQLGIIIFLLPDIKIAAIEQFKKYAFNSEISTELAPFDFRVYSQTFGLEYCGLNPNDDLTHLVQWAKNTAQKNVSVLVDVPLDYSKESFFNLGEAQTNFRGFSWKKRLNLVNRFFYQITKTYFQLESKHKETANVE